MSGTSCVFLVDEDHSARRGFTRLLRTANYEVCDFASTYEFLEALDFLVSEETDCAVPDCVVVDAGSSGLPFEMLGPELKAREVLAPIIIVTAKDDPETRQIAEEMDAVGFFHKPVDGPELLDAIDWALTVPGHESKAALE